MSEHSVSDTLIQVIIRYQNDFVFAMLVYIQHTEAAIKANTSSSPNIDLIIKRGTVFSSIFSSPNLGKSSTNYQFDQILFPKHKMTSWVYSKLS